MTGQDAELIALLVAIFETLGLDRKILESD